MARKNSTKAHATIKKEQQVKKIVSGSSIFIYFGFIWFAPKFQGFCLFAAIAFCRQFNQTALHAASAIPCQRRFKKHRHRNEQYVLDWGAASAYRRDARLRCDQDRELFGD